MTELVNANSQQHFNGMKCLTKVNAPCIENHSSESKNEFISECTSFADCVGNETSFTCQCKPGFSSSTDGKCMSDFNQTCDGIQLNCNKNALLACVDGKCQCADDSQVYSHQLKKCHGLNNVVLSKDRVKSRVKSKESVSLKCDYTGNNNCPEDTGLSCINGFCKCALGDQQYFNGTKCVSLVESICNVNKNRATSDIISNQAIWECTPYAACVTIGAHSICQCEQGFVSSETRKCIPDYLQPCNDNSLYCRLAEWMGYWRVLMENVSVKQHYMFMTLNYVAAEAWWEQAVNMTISGILKRIIRFRIPLGLQNFAHLTQFAMHQNMISEKQMDFASAELDMRKP